MGILLGLLSAATYGAADFLGGLATRRAGVFPVIIVSQMFSTPILLALLPFFLGDGPSAQALGWGAASGFAATAGIGFFYKGLSIGRMSVVAPVTAVLSSTIPVAYGLVDGERPGALSLGGVALALIAVALVSASPGNVVDGQPTRLSGSEGLWHAVVSGIGFAFFFIMLSRAGGTEAGLWPLIGARAASLATMLSGALLLRRSLRPGSANISLIAGDGLLDVAANVFYLLSTRYGLLSIVAVVTSMYPASTVVLARVVLNEKLYRLQLIGLLAAVAGMVLIATG
jgi:drug/metabolite transporter (DMT)-like permease